MERHLGYLDGEPAKAVLEVQGPLVSAEGDRVLGVQPLQFLLVVDHKDLPENTLVIFAKIMWSEEPSNPQWTSNMNRK